MDMTRINLANPQELCELPGLTGTQRDAIVRHRAEHGPIRDASELAAIMGEKAVSADLLAHVDFEPAAGTAPEAPGA